MNSFQNTHAIYKHQDEKGIAPTLFHPAVFIDMLEFSTSISYP
ncbi:hypothetical protein ACFLQ5_00560 [Bacteroidota bacterium]